MSRMKFDGKPPLPKSPIRLRSRQVLRPNSASLQTPLGSLTKSAKPSRAFGFNDLNGGGGDLRPEYRSISCELRTLAKMVQDELGNGESARSRHGENLSANSSPLCFERGKLYEEYSARRNERLKRKRCGGRDEDLMKTPNRLGVTVESSKRRDSTKKMESLRKSVVASGYGGGSGMRQDGGKETPRYSLRSMSKENKKPPVAPLHFPAVSYERSALPSERKIGVRRSVRKI
ncbi:hypothetical protein LINPERPRIM_LOCUS32511 [Linum perenne]